MPTKETPYVQLDWLCERFVRRYRNQSTKQAIRSAVQAYKKLLKQCHGYDARLAADPRFILSTHCDAFVLYNAAHYWREQKHAPLTLAERLGRLKLLFTYASEEKLTPTKTFLIPKLASRKRATMQRAAYEHEELAYIFKLFGPVFQHARRVAKGYKRTGVGRDPRSHPEKPFRVNDSADWADWNNLVWSFENVLDCATPMGPTRNIDQTFLRAAVIYHGGLREVYCRLGVTPKIELHLIAPLALKLSWETGLNAETLLTLKRDCLIDAHPLTNLPCIRYYKARSTGEKNLHLKLLEVDRPDDREVLPLEYKQSMVIRQTIELILKLTQPLVGSARPEDKAFLFLYEASRTSQRYVCHLHARRFACWSLRFLLTAKRNDEGAPANLNLSRFRPTRITHLVRQGKDLFHIQAIAGHRSVETTMRYLDAHQIAPKAQREVSRVLSHIHANIKEFHKHPKPYATKTTLGDDNVIYRGIVSDCKNIFDPPKSVRHLPTYKPNQPCTYFNMCLLCPNVLILKQHLPRLISYKNEIRRAMGNISRAPNHAHYEKTLAVIVEILREFSEEDIQWATAEAQSADYHNDSFTYHPAE